MKVGYLESHKSFCKLSLQIHYIKKKSNPSLPYGKFKIEIWAFKLLLSLKKGFNGKSTFQKFFLGISITTPYYHWILYLIENIIWRCMKSIFIDYGLFQVFGYFKKGLLCYDNSKTIQIHTMWYIYNAIVLSPLSI